MPFLLVAGPVIAPAPVLRTAERPEVRAEACCRACLRPSSPRTVLRPYDEVADMTGQTDDALVLMERAVASREPLERALAGFLSSYKGRTFDKQRRVIKHYGPAT